MHIFDCPEESSFYSYCFEMFICSYCNNDESVVEFGCGDGMPVINVLRKINFTGTVVGYEIHTAAYQKALSNVIQFDCADRYTIHHGSLFDNISTVHSKKYLIGNPPYIPAPHNNIKLPSLYGGKDGSDITKQLIDLNFDCVVLLISSYANPESIIQYGRKKGYSISNFLITPMKFGSYLTIRLQATQKAGRENWSVFFRVVAPGLSVA
jgi:methylase of polypeptide subunit release factors